MTSCLYEGRVVHRRARPVEHAFDMSLCMVYLDLADLDAPFGRSLLFSTRRPALARFDRRDHLGDPARPLDACVRDLVEKETGRRPAGSIGLLTQLRHAGYVFNPVSFYYCWNGAGDGLEAVVADVTNTPWNERYAYVLRPESETGAVLRAWTPKEFHVSPFLGMDVEYRWCFGAPGERLAASIEVFGPDGARVFDAALALERRAITRASLARALVVHPLSSARTIAAIYWQALRLYLKRAPFHPHPEATR